MKKLLTAVAFVVVSVVAPASQAIEPAALTYGLGILVGTQIGKPVPAHLTDACQAKTVKAENGNYSYTTFEHCLKK